MFIDLSCCIVFEFVIIVYGVCLESGHRTCIKASRCTSLYLFIIQSIKSRASETNELEIGNKEDFSTKFPRTNNAQDDKASSKSSSVMCDVIMGNRDRITRYGIGTPGPCNKLVTMVARSFFHGGNVVVKVELDMLEEGTSAGVDDE